MAQTGLYNNTGLATMYDIAQQYRSAGNEAAAQVVELRQRRKSAYQNQPARCCMAYY